MDLDKCLVCCWILQQTFAQIETWLIFFQQKNNDISSHGRCTCWAFSLPRSSRRCSRPFRVPRRSSQKLGAQTYLVTAKVAKIQIGWTLRLPRKKKTGKNKQDPFACMFRSEQNDNGNRRLSHQAFSSKWSQISPAYFFRRFSRSVNWCAFSLRRLRQGSLAWVIDSVTAQGGQWSKKSLQERSKEGQQPWRFRSPTSKLFCCNLLSSTMGTLFFEKMTLVRLFKLYSPPILI